MPLLRRLIVFVVFLLMQAHPLRSQIGGALTVAAAADLAYCMDELAAEFKRLHPAIELSVSYGSSGNFAAQITHGAPFDVLLSADISYPRAIAASGHADSTTMTMFAIGRIVLWTVRPDIDVRAGLNILRSRAVRRVALANPAHAPYGQAGRDALERSGIWSDIESKAVLGENIAQAAQFVQSGNADAGIVALSLVLAPRLKNIGTWFLIPDSLHRPLEQAAIVTRHGTRNPASEAFMAFLQTREARAIFGRYGFQLPSPP